MSKLSIGTKVVATVYQIEGVDVGTKGVITSYFDGRYNSNFSYPYYVKFDCLSREILMSPRHMRVETIVSAPKVTSSRAFRASHPINRRVLKHLQTRGSISPMEAIITYGIMRLAPAIHDLRAAGHAVTTELRKDANGKAYAHYELKAA